MVGAAGAAQTPKINDFRPAQKPCIKNPSAYYSYYWVPDGSLAGFLEGAFLKSGRPRGPGKAFKKVEGLPRPPGPAGPQKRTTKNRPDCLQVPNHIIS